MEQRRENNIIEEDNFKENNIVSPEKKKKRGNYIKRNLEKKVTVKHFLNTKLYAIPPAYEGDSPQFNVYVQVTFLRKTTYTRSELSNAFSQERFDALLEYQPFVDCLNREKDFIINFLRKDYYRNNEMFQEIQDRDEIDSYGTTKSVVLREFKEQISNWGKLYENNLSIRVQQGLKLELCEFIQKKIVDEIKRNTGRDILNGDDFDYFVDKINTTYLPVWQGLSFPKSISALELLVFCEGLDSEFTKVRDKYSKEIWLFNAYYNLFMSQHNEYFSPIHYTTNDLNIWSENGTFDRDFINFCRNKSINWAAIMHDIEELAIFGKLAAGKVEDFVFAHGSHVLYEYNKECFLHKFNNFYENV